MKKILTLACATMLFSACSNDKEYAYNQISADIFLKEMHSVDENYKEFSDSSKVFSMADFDRELQGKVTDDMITSAEKDIKELNKLNPSADAQAYHNGVLKYVNGIVSYGKEIKKLVSSKDLNAQKASYNQVKQLYGQLNKMPDSIMKIQLAYFDKVGLKPQ